MGFSCGDSSVKLLGIASLPKKLCRKEIPPSPKKETPLPEGGSCLTEVTLDNANCRLSTLIPAYPRPFPLIHAYSRLLSPIPASPYPFSPISPLSSPFPPYCFFLFIPSSFPLHSLFILSLFPLHSLFILSSFPLHSLFIPSSFSSIPAYPCFSSPIPNLPLLPTRFLLTAYACQEVVDFKVSLRESLLFNQQNGTGWHSS